MPRIITNFFRIFRLILFFQFFFQPLEAQWLKDQFENWKERRAERIAVTDRYQITGPMVSWTHVQDQRMSPLIYSGPGAGGFWTSYKQKPQWTELSSIWFRYNLLGGSAEALQGDITNPAAGFEWVFLRKLADPRWHLGGSISVFYQARFYEKLENDASNHDFISSLGMDLLFEQPFTWREREAWLIGRIQVPLFSYIFRIPDYNIGGINHLWAPPWQFQKLGMETSYVRKMKYSNENRWSIAYAWDFYHLNEKEKGHRLNYGVHTLKLGFWLKDR